MRTRKAVTRRRGIAAAVVAIPLSLALAGGAFAAPPSHSSAGGNPPAHSNAGGAKSPDVESRVKPIIKKGQREFRDLNANKKIDPYEDWTKSVDKRVDDLVSRMSLEDKAGLMLIDTLNAECINGDRASISGTGLDYINNQRMHRLIFRNTVTDKPVCGAPGGGFGATTSVTPAEAARFMNRVQEASERTPLGIPVLYKSNARNHIDPDARAGINESSGAFSAFPKEAGIAAAALGEQSRRTGKAPTTGDMSVVEDFAGVMGDEWESIGLRGMYGYMADLSTEPRWYRTHETFTEDADLNANIMTSLVETLQGPVDKKGVSLSPDTSVALTMKHFPGGGPQELGLDPHYSFGKTQVYPGGAFGEHLKPFEAAIDAGVSSIMPYYGAPIDVTYDGVTYGQTGMAFSSQINNDLLRGKLGFQGYVNSDTGIINDRAWGLENASVPERVAAAVNGGTDTLSGFHDVKTITDLVAGGKITEERVTLAAERLLTPMFQMGLFENPYVDEAEATATVGSEVNRKVGLDVQRKSAVLLQNKEAEDGDKALPLKDGSSVYILGDFKEETVAAKGYTVINGNKLVDGKRPSAAGADKAIITVTAKNKNTSTYDSKAAAADPKTPINPIVMPGTAALDGQHKFGAEDVCVSYDTSAPCTDNGLRFGGSFPWESSILDFSGMAESQSWQVVPSLSEIQQVMNEVGAENTILHVYFRQPFVLDEASGLRDAGAIVAGFGISDTALMDVLSGDFKPQGKMPFALAGTRAAIEQQFSDLPGYKETEDGALFPFGFGLTYDDDRGGKDDHGGKDGRGGKGGQGGRGGGHR
ncbi:glycoside hydrolase family 3 N-terminal domain-containing protein [Georgenia sp. SYP-B2076]|uniref:glycoside hydrolase family 3 protein n=1 Tax=Georgenia sp. SYP-B2076 TaxID=2495881 RepID=UPI000F8ED064|nr:glycoside hydrolase family 3 N-terminal domain-containing protein [Georgenia sp. SYP-B2076]